MHRPTSNQFFAFVWGSRNVSHTVVDLARRTSSLAIFDLSSRHFAQMATALRLAGATAVRISANDFMEQGIEVFLDESGVKTLWIEYHPDLFSGTPESFLERLGNLSAKCACVPVTSDLELLHRLVQRHGPPMTVALKGNEAAGFVGGETIGVLYSSMIEMVRARGRNLDLVIWGGIATPEAAAAYLATGAQGIVFESLHWQTDLVAVDDRVRNLIAKLSPEHTSIVGRTLGVFYRLFDKGNFPAMRELEHYAHSLSDDPITAAKRRAFAQHVVAAAVPALESDLDRQQLIPLGPEAAFAQAFVERFGRSSAEAIQGFMVEVARLLQNVKNTAQRFLSNPAARELGTTYPFIQGGMTWISDVPEFALAVAEAGGLPTLALGIRDRRQLETDFTRLRSIMGTRPYAVNLIALAENPVFEEQLAWVEETRPPFVAIAAGDPAHAVRLREKGIEVIYITADVGLLRLALEGGVRWLVLEGNEAGGHVGAHSALTLTQIVLELKRREPKLFEGRRLVLAGGIFNRETALRAAMMGADGIQMGTVYLATREIVATGALSQLYQRLILEAQPGATALSGETIGLRVRSLKTPKMDAILSLEREFVASNEDESDFRRRLETLSAKSLLIASRGRDQAVGSPLNEETCLEKGQFMSGAVSGMINRVVTIAELHQELAAGPLQEPLTQLEPAMGKVVRSTSKSKNGRERVAITGMALVNSLGNTPGEIWENVLALKSGITEVPASRWDYNSFYEPRPGAKEKTYCKVGAFKNISISRKDLDIPPQDFRTMSNSTKLTLYLANQVIKDAGLVDSNIPRERIGILISQNSGESASTLGDLVIGMSAQRIVHTLQDFLNLTPEQALKAEQHIKAGCMTVDDTTLLGRLNSAAGGFISNRFGFMGPCYSVSAACATSLVAIYSAIQMIQNGVIDAAVVGGGEENLYPAHYVEFSALGALAGVSGLACPPEASSRPFDSTRDGFVLGEGGGMIVIERESVAKKRGARVYSFITGVGASNNDRGMIESVAETQMIAIGAGFQDAAYGPETVDLVECHATSTVQGDLEEVQALKSFYSNGRRVMLSSFKSQIAHCLGTSGINSLIRGVMAMQAGLFPPTLNYHSPDPEIDLERCGFHVLPQPAEWPRPADRPRRLQVDAFGFGGANFVVQVEESLNGTGVVLVPGPQRLQTGPEVKAKDEPTPVTSLDGVSFLRTRIKELPYRLGVVAENDKEARAKVAALDPLTTPLADKTRRALAGQGIFAAPEDDAVAPMALVFAGQGTYYPGMGRNLYQTFPLVRQWMERIAAEAEANLLELMFNSQDKALQKTLWQQPALFALEYAVVRQLLALGVKPAAMAGHSMGEILALCVAGVFSWQDGFRIISKRAQCMDKAATLNVDPGAMIAVDVPMEVLQQKLARCSNVHITNFNSPRQLVLGGGTDEVLGLKAELEQEGYWTAQLRVSMAFHSPIMQVIREEMAEFLAAIELHPPQIPVISNTTRKPYPDDPEVARKILLDHLENPVHWQQNVETLWHEYGVRNFVEIGPKETLCNLIADTLEKARCIPTSLPENEAYAFRTAAAQLYALGYVQPLRPAAQVAFASPAPAPAPVSRPIPAAAADHRVAAVVQREINAFVLDTMGKYLKPAILDAIRREVDPSFSEDRFEAFIQAGFSAALAPAAAAPSSVTPRSAATSVPATGPQPLDDLPPILEGDYVERVIRIIMDATGYERDEIEPHMDIRRDLAIRSSRLPVIMDAAERQFGINIKLEDFINVRTVQEIADRIALVQEREGGNATSGASSSAPAAGEETVAVKATDEALSQPKEIKRLVFGEVPLGEVSGNRLKLPAGQEVGVMSLSPGSTLAAAVADLLQAELEIVPLALDFSDQFDLRSPEGAAKAAQHLAGAPALAGLVLVLDETANAVQDLEGIPALLSGFFGTLQQLTSSLHRKFCFLISRGAGAADPAAVMIEGVKGMFLDAALEYDSVLFRSVALDRETELAAALQQALNLDHHLVEISFHGQEAFSIEGRVQPLSLGDAPDLKLNPGDVVVISGGGKGITPHLAYALAPFKPRLILLGSSEFDPEAAAQPASGQEIARTLKELAGQGMEATYYSCDVSDQASVAAVLGRVVEQYGGIAGVIHGAGILRDSFIEFMTAADFTKVVEVKLLGAWNLYQAAREHGLRFMVMLSSITAVRGNVGQINYCAGNRAMSALTQVIASQQPSVRTKALMLPPIEGAGMADDPEVRELIRLKGMAEAYISVSELTELFYRELFLGPAQEHWVLPVRTLPPLKTVWLNLEEPTPAPGWISAAGVAYRDNDFPMIQTIHHLEIGAGTLEAGRTFSLDHDLWMEDHRPFKFMKDPFVSGVMALETFMEAAHLLCPHLTPRGVRQVQYLDILECPPGISRESRIVCRRLKENEGGEVLCDVSLSSQDITTTGRVLDRWTTNYNAQVILGVSGQPLPDWPGFTIKPEELDSAQFDQKGMLLFYKKFSDFKDRYQVLKGLDGTSSGVIRGRTIFSQKEDFAGLKGVRYHYSPYLLEALKHLVNSHLLLRDENVTAAMIPFGIGEMRFSRVCRPGEEIVLEGRRRSLDNGEATWDARAVDAAGQTIMTLKGLIMKSFSA